MIFILTVKKWRKLIHISFLYDREFIFQKIHILLFLPTFLRKYWVNLYMISNKWSQINCRTINNILYNVTAFSRKSSFARFFNIILAFSFSSLSFSLDLNIWINQIKKNLIAVAKLLFLLNVTTYNIVITAIFNWVFNIKNTSGNRLRKKSYDYSRVN